MKAKELRVMARNELMEKLQELTKELIKDRAAAATGTTPKNPSKVKTNRRTIARIHHTLSQQQLEEHIT